MEPNEEVLTEEQIQKLGIAFTDDDVVDVVVTPSSINAKKQPNGTLHIMQSRPGLFVVLEYQDGTAIMKYPRLMSLCQLCSRIDCNKHGKISRFASCSRRLVLTRKTLDIIFKELIQRDILNQKPEV